MDHRGVDRGVGGEVELLDAFVAGEAGVVDAAGGAALVPVVALGHDEFGEEAANSGCHGHDCRWSDTGPLRPPPAHGVPRSSSTG
jgi:hypothetical protein